MGLLQECSVNTFECKLSGNKVWKGDDTISISNSASTIDYKIPFNGRFGLNIFYFKRKGIGRSKIAMKPFPIHLHTISHLHI